MHSFVLFSSVSALIGLFEAQCFPDFPIFLELLVSLQHSTLFGELLLHASKQRSSGITYSASNAYLDGLSLWRRFEQLPCSSLQRLVGCNQNVSQWCRVWQLSLGWNLVQFLKYCNIDHTGSSWCIALFPWLVTVIYYYVAFSGDRIATEFDQDHKLNHWVTSLLPQDCIWVIDRFGYSADDDLACEWELCLFQIKHSKCHPTNQCWSNTLQ